MTTSRGMRIVKALAVIAIVVWSVGPIVMGVTTSISTQREVNAIPSHWLPQHPTFKAYDALLNGSSGQFSGGTVTQQGEFVQAMTTSAELSLGGAGLTLIVATMAAYALARLRFRLGGLVLSILIGTMVIPIFVVVIGLFRVLADAQLIDTKRGLVLVFVATLTPLATWLLYTQVREMPTEPEEAALIDGCSRWQAFLRVVLPQMASGIAAVAAILALSVWGEFLIPLLLSSTTNAKPVTVLITEYVGKYTTNYPILAAGGVLALIPPAVLALALNRRITGMLAGSS
jgi:multiple sugar transport system permease protein